MNYKKEQKEAKEKAREAMRGKLIKCSICGSPSYIRLFDSKTRKVITINRRLYQTEAGNYLCTNRQECTELKRILDKGGAMS
jgi:hypothetical protein